MIQWHKITRLVTWLIYILWIVAMVGGCRCSRGLGLGTTGHGRPVAALSHVAAHYSHGGQGQWPALVGLHR
jgi:hypothetical protein